MSAVIDSQIFWEGSCSQRKGKWKLLCEPQFRVTNLKMSDVISVQWRITPGANLEILEIWALKKSPFGSNPAGGASICRKFPT